VIAIFASLLFSVFPVRGSVIRSLDSVLVVDRDTVRVNVDHCLCMCPDGKYEISLSTDSSRRIQPFPGTRYPSGRVEIAGSGGKLLGTDASGMFPICSTWVSISPENVRRFLLHGSSGDWAVWADSIHWETRWPSTVVFTARWRWSRIDTAVPWVRWVDTVRLASGVAPVGLPVLTTLDSVALGHLGPVSQMPHLGLILRDSADTATPVDWGFRDAVLPVPAGEIPPGWTFRVLDAFNPGGGAVQWEFTADGKVADRIWMVGQATSEVDAPTLLGPVRSGNSGYEPTTGRRIRLERPLPIGKHLLNGPEGTRLIVVE